MTQMTKKEMGNLKLFEEARVTNENFCVVYSFSHVSFEAAIGYLVHESRLS